MKKKITSALNNHYGEERIDYLVIKGFTYGGRKKTNVKFKLDGEKKAHFESFNDDPDIIENMLSHFHY